LRNSIIKLLNYGNDFFILHLYQLTSFILNDSKIDLHQLLNDELELHSYSDFEHHTLTIIKNWFSDQKYFSLKTSGSTGNPKTLHFTREQLTKSAKRTLKTFNLKVGDKVLACLNPKYVAGMMMLIRALEGNLSLIILSPSSNPLVDFTSNQNMDFASFSPNQIDHILRESPDKLALIKTILIGGAGLHTELEKMLISINSEIYHSYAMTETLTHTALRKISGDEKTDIYHALEGVTFEIDKRSCLIIHDELLGVKRLITNDNVELINDRSFILKGRYDNVINTGGIKIQIEEVEQNIRSVFMDMKIENPFCLIAQPDLSLTNMMVMLMENNPKQIGNHILINKIKEKLPKYHAPKKIILVPKIYLTATGKIDRNKNQEMYIYKNLN